MSKINHIYRIKISQKFPKKSHFENFEIKEHIFRGEKKKNDFFLEFCGERIFFISTYSAYFRVLKAENAFLECIDSESHGKIRL